MQSHFSLRVSTFSAREVAELCQLAEETDWDGCFLRDAIWCEDPIVSLAAAAMVTRRIRMGTMIIPMTLRTSKILSPARENYCHEIDRRSTRDGIRS